MLHQEVKCTVLIQFCILVLRLKEKSTSKKNHHLSKPQAVFSPTSPCLPSHGFCRRPSSLPSRRLAHSMPAHFWQGGKKTHLEQKAFWVFPHLWSLSLTCEAFVFFKPCSANFVSPSPSPPSVEIFYSLQAWLSAENWFPLGYSYPTALCIVINDHPVHHRDRHGATPSQLLSTESAQGENENNPRA